VKVMVVDQGKALEQMNDGDDVGGVCEKMVVEQGQGLGLVGDGGGVCCEDDQPHLQTL
jgi:hypothetical protein